MWLPNLECRCPRVPHRNHALLACGQFLVLLLAIGCGSGEQSAQDYSEGWTSVLDGALIETSERTRVFIGRLEAMNPMLYEAVRRALGPRWECLAMWADNSDGTDVFSWHGGLQRIVIRLKDGTMLPNIDAGRTLRAFGVLGQNRLEVYPGDVGVTLLVYHPRFDWEDLEEVRANVGPLLAGEVTCSRVTGAGWMYPPGMFGKNEVLHTLIAQLDSTSPTDRAAAADSLATLGAKAAPAIPALRFVVLRDKDAGAVRSARRALRIVEGEWDAISGDAADPAMSGH